MKEEQYALFDPRLTHWYRDRVWGCGTAERGRVDGTAY